MGTIVLLQTDGIRIPNGIPSLESFRAWASSDAFPEKGRIDWIGGDLEVDMSPEEGNTHGTAKVAIAADLRSLVEGSDRGVVYVDAMRLVAPEADLSSEPDVLVVLFESLEAGRVRLPRQAGSERYLEIEGAADLVVECVSDSSEEKDRVRLRDRYHRAGVREYWIVDARRTPPALSVLVYAPDGYVESAPDADGWTPSPVIERAVRLVRLPPRAGVVRYRLEMR